jgi:hypothetical protein
MSGAIPPLPEYAFMASCSVKAQGQLYFHSGIQSRRFVHLCLLNVLFLTSDEVTSLQYFISAHCLLVSCAFFFKHKFHCHEADQEVLAPYNV